MNDWSDNLVNIIFGNRFMTIATADVNCIPWISPVVYACDGDLRFYWVSGEGARHSINISENSRVAIVVFDSQQQPGKVQALYAEGSATELRGEDLKQGTRQFYGWRYPDPDTLATKIRGPEQFEGESPRRMYRLTPDRIFGLDPEGDPVHGGLLDARVPVQIRRAFSKVYLDRFGH